VLRIEADRTESYEPIAAYDAWLKKFVPVPIDLGPETDQLFLILFGAGAIRGKRLVRLTEECANKS
jgi:hypothetical protein